MIHACILYQENGQDNKSNDTNNNNNKDTNQLSPSKPEVTIVPVKPTRSVYTRAVLSFSVIENTNKLLTISSDRYASIDTLRVLFSLLIFPINSLGIARANYPAAYRYADGILRYEMLVSNTHWINRIPGLWFDGFVLIL